MLFPNVFLSSNDNSIKYITHFDKKHEDSTTSDYNIQEVKEFSKRVLSIRDGTVGDDKMEKHKYKFLMNYW